MNSICLNVCACKDWKKRRVSAFSEWNFLKWIIFSMRTETRICSQTVHLICWCHITGKKTRVQQLIIIKKHEKWKNIFENKSSDFYIFFYVQVHTLKQQNSFWILFLIFNKICALKRWKKIKERSFSNWNFTNWFYCYQVENSKTNKSIKVQRADLTCRFWLNIMVFISRFELLSSVLRTSSLCWFNVTINL